MSILSTTMKISFERHQLELSDPPDGHTVQNSAKVTADNLATNYQPLGLLASLACMHAYESSATVATSQPSCRAHVGVEGSGCKPSAVAPTYVRAYEIKSGDEVVVRIEKDGSTRWQKGIVPSLEKFPRRATATGSYAYPVRFLDRPGIMVWYDPGHVQMWWYVRRAP